MKKVNQESTLQEVKLSGSTKIHEFVVIAFCFVLCFAFFFKIVFF